LLDFPTSSAADSEDINSALDTGLSLWNRGEQSEPLRWLRQQPVVQILEKPRPTLDP